jgi:hypothetical protein
MPSTPDTTIMATVTPARMKQRAEHLQKEPGKLGRVMRRSAVIIGVSRAICFHVWFPAMLFAPLDSVLSAAEPGFGACRKADTPPVIDGVLTDSCWTDVPILTDFSVLGTNDRAAKQTEVKVCHDGKKLYIAARMFEPQPERLIARYTKRDSDVYHDDSFEIFVDSNLDRRTYFQFIINSKAVVYDQKHGDVGWNSHVSTASSRGDDFWTVEVAIPWEDLGVEKPGGKILAVNFCRDDHVSETFSSWSAVTASFLEPQSFGHLLIDMALADLTAGQLKALRQVKTLSGSKPEPEVGNGSFEDLLPGIAGDYPEHWTEERWTALDKLELVNDPARAHWGRRYLRLHAPGDAQIRVHSISRKAIELRPGHSYTFRAWARREPGADKATLFIEPGRAEVELTDQWKQYRCTYRHPADAKAMKTGMYIGILGGPAAVDDVSLAPGETEPQVAAELKADRSRLKALPVMRDWPDVEGEPLWQERAAIKVSEVMGVPVHGGLVDIELRNIFPGRLTYKHLTRERLKVVDASLGEEVPWALVNLRESNEQWAKSCGKFSIVLAASLPARSTKTYHVYLAEPEDGQAEVRWQGEVPAELVVKPGYAHKLDWWRGKPQKRIDLSCREQGGVIDVRVRGWTAGKVSGQLISPDGQKKIALPLNPDRTEPKLWVSRDGHRLPGGSAEGIWKFQAKLEDSSGVTEQVSTGFAHGSTLWWHSNVERIFRDDAPQYGQDREVDICAARNEAEAFQLAIDASEGLEDVGLSVTDAVHENGRSSIPTEAFKIERIREVYLSSPPGARAGWYPNALLPWRQCDIEAGRRKLAWITVSVPKDTAAGDYRGKVVVSSAGKRIELPLKLTVFDFTLPERPAFTALMGVELSGGWQGRSKSRLFGGEPNRYRGVGTHHIWNEITADFTAVVTLARMTAERRMSLHYYYAWSSAYPAPWRYNRAQKQAEFDFRMFDHNLEILLDELGVNCVTLASEHRTAATQTGFIRDGGPWMKTGASTRRNTTNERAYANELARAWARGMGAHLKEKGWLDRAFVYVTDEPVPKILPVTSTYLRALKTGHPQLKTFGAGKGLYGWAEYHEQLDAFASGYSVPETFQGQLAERGVAYWGVYNRLGGIAFPLARARIVGLDCWDRGYKGFFEHASVGLQTHDLSVNPQSFTYHRSPPGYPVCTFIRSAEPASFSFAYPWPADEPLPEPVTRPRGREFVIPVGTEDHVEFVPAGQDRPFASSLRLEALRESIDDYDYLELLRSALEIRSADPSLRKRYEALRLRLKKLLEEGNLGTDVHHTEERSTFVVGSAPLQRLRRDIGRAVETISKEVAGPS